MSIEAERAGRARKWIKIGLLVLAILALIAVVVTMISGGDHGPAHHFSLETAVR